MEKLFCQAFNFRHFLEKQAAAFYSRNHQIYEFKLIIIL